MRPARRWLGMAIALALVAAGCGGSSSSDEDELSFRYPTRFAVSPDLYDPDGVYLFVINEYGGTLSAVDVRLNDNEILFPHRSKLDAEPGTFLDVGDYPVSLEATADGERVYVCNANGNGIWAVDVGGWTTRKLDINVGPCEMKRVGESIWITDPRLERIAVFDPATETIESEIALDAVPRAMAASPDAQTVYLTTADGTIHALDAASFDEVADPLYNDSNPGRLAVNPAGDRLYVVTDEPSLLLEIDPADLSELADPVEVPGRLRDVMVTPDDEWVYMTNSNGYAYVYSRRTGHVCDSYASEPEFEDVGAISNPVMETPIVEDCQVNEQEWEVRYDQAEREWVVEGEKAGKQVNRAQMDRTYVSDDGSFQFLIRSGTRAPSDEDQFTFETNPGNEPIRVGALPEGLAVVPDYDEPEFWIVWVANSLSDNLNHITTDDHQVIGALR